MSKSVCVTFATFLLISGCTYQSVIDITPADAVYAAHGDKIKGKWTLFIDSGDFQHQTIRTKGFNCAAHFVFDRSRGRV